MIKVVNCLLSKSHITCISSESVKAYGRMPIASHCYNQRSHFCMSAHSN